ncbi:MAG TPA: hypothetical protein VIB39_20650 [Candidatus Angelobacter sp.]|jgi:hypothetical protein
MAASKSKRSARTAQHQAQPQQHPHPQLKSQLFETLKHLNRGFGVALAAFDRLQKQDRWQKPGMFPTSCLLDYRNRTEELRARANFELLHFFSGREEREAEKFERLRRSRG